MLRNHDCYVEFQLSQEVAEGMRGGVDLRLRENATRDLDTRLKWGRDHQKSPAGVPAPSRKEMFQPALRLLRLPWRGSG